MASIPSIVIKDEDLQRRLDQIRETQRVRESDFVSLGGRKFCDWLLSKEQHQQPVNVKNPSLSINFSYLALRSEGLSGRMYEIFETIVDYTRRSTTLRSVVLFGSIGVGPISRMVPISAIIRAIVDNPSITIVLLNAYLDPIDLGLLVRNTVSLERLHIGKTHWDDLSSEQNHDLADAFRSNDTLRCVQFADGGVTNEILSSVVCNKRLQELHISCERLRSPRTSVFTVLQSASQSLRHLVISRHTFETTGAESVIHVLPLLPTIITTLSILHCGFDTDASSMMFVDQLYRLQSLRELHLVLWFKNRGDRCLISAGAFSKVATLSHWVSAHDTIFVRIG